MTGAVEERSGEGCGEVVVRGVVGRDIVWGVGQIEIVKRVSG